MLELKNIYKYYTPGTVNEMCLFQDFSLKVSEGEFVSVVGSNGSGKTSMLNIICGSIPVESGQVCVGGKDITREKEYKRNEQMVFTSYLSLKQSDTKFTISAVAPITAKFELIHGYY